jgi:hypothetical protein
MQEKVNVIISAIDIAIAKGCYNLNDVANIVDAIREVFPAEQNDNQEETK